jgi:hypothetical protein
MPLAEGYSTLTTTRHYLVYDYPGWYTPYQLTDDWQNKRYPYQPYYDISTMIGDEWQSNETHKFTRPAGMSLLEYLSSPNVNVPVKAEQNAWNFTSKFVTMSDKPHLDNVAYLNPYEGNNYADSQVPVTPYRCFLPLDARNWFYTIEISTELADTFYVEENYLNIEIQNPKVSDTDLSYLETTSITMTLVNKLNLTGYVWIYLQVKEGAIGIQSGIGKLIFNANEVKNHTVILQHTALFDTDVTGKFVLYVWNGEKRTSEYYFELLLRKSFGVQNTKIKVVALTTDSKPIAGIAVKVVYSEKVKYSMTPTDTSGELILDLAEQYKGDTTVFVWDTESNRYESQNKTQSVSPEQTNVFTFNLKLIGQPPTFWEILLAFLQQNAPYIIGGSIGIAGLGAGAYALKRRREVMY